MRRFTDLRAGLFREPLVSGVPGMIDRPAAELFEGIPGNPPNLAEKMRDEAVDGTWQGELLNR